MKSSKNIRAMLTGIVGGLTLALLGETSIADTKTFKETAVEINGVKFWLPDTLIVKKGDTVKIHAVSKVPGAGSVHGFQIEAYGINEVIDAKGKDLEFTASKPGIFPIKCHLHEAHVGGQLIVME